MNTVKENWQNKADYSATGNNFDMAQFYQTGCVVVARHLK